MRSDLRPSRRATRAARAGALPLALLAAVILAACGRPSNDRLLTGRVLYGDPETGRALIERYGCASCHTIPGIRHPDTWVAPPLERFARRSFIAGRIANTPENLALWIDTPPAVDPRTAMPDLGVSRDEARHIAAYLYTLD